MKIAILVAAVSLVAVQPIFGWHAMPRFFNYSAGSAVAIGILNGLFLFGAIVLVNAID